jgi:hypothetical protein
MTALPALTSRIYRARQGADGAPDPYHLREAMQRAFPLLGTWPMERT